MWKVSKYGVISSPYFPVFGLNTWKYGPEINPYLDIFKQCKILQSKHGTEIQKTLSTKSIILFTDI